MRLGGCFLSVVLTTGFTLSISNSTRGPSMIWVADGLLLAYLLLAPRWRWPAYLVAGYAGRAAAVFLVTGYWQLGLVMPFVSVAEVAITALLLRKRSTQLPKFTDRAYLIRFCCFAVLVGPLVGAVILAFVFRLPHSAPGPSFAGPGPLDLLGIAIATPAFVAILQTRFRNRVKLSLNWLYPLLLAVITVLSFSKAGAPLMALIYPLLVLILVSFGLGQAALATLFVAAVGGCYTIRGAGPLAMARSLDPASPSLRLQIYVASAIFLLYVVSVVLESRKATERRLQKIAALHALVTENSHDAIILADFKGNRSYVSAAAERLSGWTPEELMNQVYSDMIHPDDLAKALTVQSELSSGTECAVFVSRLRKRDGTYFWAESSLSVVRDPTTNAPRGVLNVVRDITDRRRAEESLQEAYKTLEAFAITDALTGLANRRRFDQCLANEWRRAMRDHKPLSMLLIDADLFKSFNDTYGHLRGDSCLKQIAEAAQDVVTRPGDLVARFGGEEFAIILPNTDNEGAMQVAEDICEAMRNRKLPHSSSHFGFMTISIGCATLEPVFGKHSVDLVEFADQALYLAKGNGRNQVCNGNEMRATESTPKDSGPSEIVAGKSALAAGLKVI
jgi:diguanylate cyclase (GGDEF)-like protein/PAS domain S-box-containing protein